MNIRIAKNEEKTIEMQYEIMRIVDSPDMLEKAAQWFHEKWGIPLEAYEESMKECLEKKSAVPQWYVAVEGEKIIGGMGVIENDFHDRKDLTPNICAVYVEEGYRGRGIAGELLNYVCTDMNRIGIDTLYLVTDHTSFYERYGWEFLCMVQGDGEPDMTRMYVHKMDTSKDTLLLNRLSCAKFIAGLTRDGRLALEQHMKDYNEVLLHIFAWEAVGMPLVDLLKNPSGQEEKIKNYCKAIEYMWKCGDKDVCNVVDVTILETLSDDDDVWTAFGKNISNEFIRYINEDELVNNLMMGGVKPLALNKEK